MGRKRTVLPNRARRASVAPEVLESPDRRSPRPLAWEVYSGSRAYARISPGGEQVLTVRRRAADPLVTVDVEVVPGGRTFVEVIVPRH